MEGLPVVLEKLRNTGMGKLAEHLTEVLLNPMSRDDAIGRIRRAGARLAEINQERERDPWRERIKVCEANEDLREAFRLHHEMYGIDREWTGGPLTWALYLPEIAILEEYVARKAELEMEMNG
jgi:hypothetical protein